MSLLNQAAQVQSQLTSTGAPFELRNKQVNGQTYSVYVNAPSSLAQVIQDARRTDEQNFLVYQDQRLSFKQFFERLDSLASWMHEHGVKKGDKVVIAMRNRPEWVLAFCAAASLGAVPAPLNSFGTAKELSECVDSIDPMLLVCDAARWERINQQSKWQGQTLVLNDAKLGLDKFDQLNDFIDALNHPVIQIETPHLTDLDPALILFTSGATSKAKAVVSSHIAVCQALYNIDFIGALSAMTSPEALKRIMDKKLIPTLLTAVPLFHVSGLHAQLLTALRGGRRLIFTHKWIADEAIELIKNEHVTQFNGAPSMVMQLLRHPKFSVPEIMDNFCGLGFGGSGLPASLVDSALSILHEQMVGIGFGMTETNGVCAAISGNLFNYKPKSSGLISPIMDVRICAANGDVLSANEEGEVYMRGVSLMDGYVADKQATNDAMRNGWLRSGDIGYIDEEGFLFIVDRIKDVIIRSGENISAAEVESCLLEHAQVEEAAVFAVSDDETGEAVVAVIKPFDNATINLNELIAHAEQRLAKYKVPSTMHVSQTHLPRNPAGKLLRHEVKKSIYSENALCSS